MASSRRHYRPTVVELFAGGGGAALGLKQAGYRSIIAVDMWDVAIKTLRAAGHTEAFEGPVGDRRVVDEVRRRVDKLGHLGLDLLWASPPCQPYSSSGLRLGKLDPRDGWVMTIGYVELLRPRAVIVENVKNAPVGEWAAAIGELGHLPYHGAFHLTASDYGHPQDRTRAFVYAGPRPLKDFLAAIDRHRAPAPSIADVLPHLEGYYVRSEQTTSKARSTAEACPTIATHGNIYVHKVDVGVRRVGYRKDPRISRRMTISEQLVLQGFPVDYPLAGNVDDKYKQIGNSVVPHVARLIGDAVLEMIHAAR